jgi:hypothetical protein
MMMCKVVVVLEAVEMAANQNVLIRYWSELGDLSASKV